jgi:DNA-binding CsgD family transcriptional regulator
MQGRHFAAIAHRAANFFKFRDELTIQNIRWELWPVLLVLPLTVIMGDLRFLDLEINIAGFETYELLMFPLGLGCLVTAFIPKRLILPALRAAVVFSALILPLEFLFPANEYRFPMLMAFHFFNGICEACAFALFCFKLNNVERLSAMILIQFYFGFLFTVCRAFPEFQSAMVKWGGIAVMAAYLVVVFMLPTRRVGDNSRKHEILPDTEKGSLTGGQAGSSGAVFVIALGAIHFIIQCLVNYVEWADDIVSSMAFGIGAFASIVLLIFIQLVSNRSALYTWLLFLALTLFALGALIFDSPVTRLPGSFAYGLGEGLGYIIINYLIGGAIKKSRSLKIFRLYCVVTFVEYFFISGVLTLVFGRFELPNHYLAIGVILFLCSVCFLLMPLMQKKLFETDWTDGIQLQDITDYAGPLAETEIINTKDDLSLTDREREIFAMLLNGKSPKEIAHTLKVSFHTIAFHRTNLYRKLGIQSIQELFAKYLPSTGGKTG